MRRRKFVALVGTTVATSPAKARAQQATKLPTIGFLLPNTPVLDSERVETFVRRMGELGWIEGQNVRMAYRWAEGRKDRFAEITAEFVSLKVDLIVSSGTVAIIAAKKATSVIPIVFAAVGDPVGNGLVASLAHPGGNITGFSLQATDLAAKRLQLLAEIVPGLHRLAIIANSDSPAAMTELREVEATAGAFKFEVVTLKIQSREDIGTAIAAIKDRAEALYVCNDPLMTTNRNAISDLAIGIHLPTAFLVREFVDAGGLLSYGPSFLALYRQTAEVADKILRGANPSDIPVQQATQFELFINHKTAKALGLTIPPSLLMRADKVIE